VLQQKASPLHVGVREFKQLLTKLLDQGRIRNHAGSMPGSAPFLNVVPFRALSAQKLNDLLVARRQKGPGRHGSQGTSDGLAALRTLLLNDG